MFETWHIWKILYEEWCFISEELEEPSSIRPGDSCVVRVAKRCGIP